MRRGRRDATDATNGDVNRTRLATVMATGNAAGGAAARTRVERDAASTDVLLAVRHRSHEWAASCV